MVCQPQQHFLVEHIINRLCVSVLFRGQLFVAFQTAEQRVQVHSFDRRSRWARAPMEMGVTWRCLFINFTFLHLFAHKISSIWTGFITLQTCMSQHPSLPVTLSLEKKKNLPKDVWQKNCKTKLRESLGREEQGWPTLVAANSDWQVRWLLSKPFRVTKWALKCTLVFFASCPMKLAWGHHDLFLFWFCDGLTFNWVVVAGKQDLMLYVG